jgi:hypothetical protein
MPVSDFYDMPSREIAGADPMQQAGYNNVGTFFQGGSPALNNAFDMAGGLGKPPQWGGVDLSGVGRVGGLNLSGPTRTSPQPGGGGPPPGGGGAPAAKPNAGGGAGSTPSAGMAMK